MKEDSFESVKSDLFDEKNNINNYKEKDDENSLIFEEQKDKIYTDRNSSIINESKKKIRNSLMFSNFKDSSSSFNNLNTTDILKNSKNQNINIDNIYSKESPEQINLIQSQSKNQTPFLEIPDKKNTKIILVKVIDQNYYEGHLRLKNNLTSEYLIFKILNDKLSYSITPCLYYIEPGKDIIINIKRFEKLTINEIKNIFDYIIVLVAHTKNKIEDVNDAKMYINKNDVYSPEYQLYSYNIVLDYGYSNKIYEKEEKERKNIFNKYESQLNMNKITDIEKVKYYINNVKKEIDVYQKKIEDLKSILNDIGHKNIIKQEETIFDKETYYQLSTGKIYKELGEDDDKDNNDIQLPLLFLYLSICLFIGKFLKFFLFS